MQAQRVERLRRVMKEADLPAMFITNAYNCMYMTGFTGSSGYVLITQERTVLFTDFRYMTQAVEQAKDYEVIEHKPRVIQSVLELLQEEKLDVLGFEQNDLTYGSYSGYTDDLQGVQFVPTDNVIEQIRMIKDAGELSIMKEAAELADQTFSHVLGLIKPGVSENAIALEIEMFIRRNGGTSTSFDTIVASGVRSALPHGVASGKLIQENEFVTLDFGAYYNGYCSDITRTVFVGKNPSDKHKEIYDIVLKAQLNCLKGLRPGMTGHEGDALCRDIITEHGYGGQFGHSTGHGLGMEVHEQPRVSPRDQTILVPGMAVTVEPGIYIPGFGGVRIEDDIVLVENGIHILTSSTKELLILS